jgi:hypothetical protein
VLQHSYNVDLVGLMCSGSPTMQLPALKGIELVANLYGLVEKLGYLPGLGPSR